MKLRLPHAPAPANAHKLAQIAVESALEIDGLELDYSPGSLADVDKVLHGFHEEGIPVERIGSAIFCMGCYIGEAFVRHARGRWIEGSQSALAGKDANHWMVVALPGDREVNPIGKAFKRVEEGKTASIPYFWKVFARADASQSGARRKKR